MIKIGSEGPGQTPISGSLAPSWKKWPTSVNQCLVTEEPKHKITDARKVSRCIDRRLPSYAADIIVHLKKKWLEEKSIDIEIKLSMMYICADL